MYHVATKPSKVADVCDRCGGPLVTIPTDVTPDEIYRRTVTALAARA